MADVPRVAGGALRWLARALENPLLGPPLAARAHHAAGLATLRATPAEAAPPSTKPWLEAPLEAREDAHPALPPEAAWHAARDAAAGRGEASACQEAYRSGAIEPVLLAERLLGRAEGLMSLTPAMGSLVALDLEGLRAGAAASAARWAAGKPFGPLDGVPVLVKDELDQKGVPTGVGTGFLAKRGPAGADATAVARLRAQGALLLGKTAMHEVGLGTTGANATHGPARNPHNPAHYAGGSSGGSASAVACGLVPLALGADGGGSIRIPSGLCGVWGLKPTAGRVSEYGAYPLCWTVAHVGPIAASPADLALGYAAIAGPDPMDTTTLSQPGLSLPDLGLGLAGLRVGVDRAWVDEASPDMAQAFYRWMARLEEAGAVVVPLVVPHRKEMAIAHLVSISAEMACALLPHLEQQPEAFGPEARAHLAMGRRVSAADYLHAQRLRPMFAQALGALYGLCDVVISPTTAIAAPLIQPEEVPYGSSDLDQLAQLMNYAQAANLTGFPALSVPMGLTEGGLPLGAQAMAAPWREALLLRFAFGVEALAPQAQPSCWVPPAWHAT